MLPPRPRNPKQQPPLKLRPYLIPLHLHLTGLWDAHRKIYAGEGNGHSCNDPLQNFGMGPDCVDATGSNANVYTRHEGTSDIEDLMFALGGKLLLGGPQVSPAALVRVVQPGPWSPSSQKR